MRPHVHVLGRRLRRGRPLRSDLRHRCHQLLPLRRWAAEEAESTPTSSRPTAPLGLTAAALHPRPRSAWPGRPRRTTSASPATASTATAPSSAPRPHLVHLLRPHLRDDVHARRRRLRRGGQPLHHGVASQPPRPRVPAAATRRSHRSRRALEAGDDRPRISVSWGASSDNVGVTGYGLHRNGASAGTSPPRAPRSAASPVARATRSALDAFDAAGQPQLTTSLTTATSACPPPADTASAFGPQGMAFGAITQTTVALGWNASTDNVGVVGYRLLRDGSASRRSRRRATPTRPDCGTSYTFALEAYDAAGNVSDRASRRDRPRRARAPAPPPPPPPPPPRLPPPAPHGEPLGRHERRILRPAGDAGRVHRRSGLLVERRLPGSADRRPDPCPWR